jgi:hypothetical protein
MRTTLHTAALLAAVTLVTASAQPAMAATATTATATTAAGTTAAGTTSWSPALAGGSGAGVAVVDGVARIDQGTAFLAPADPASAAVPNVPVSGTRGSERGMSLAEADGRRAPISAVATGLLTLPEHILTTATNRIATSVDAQSGAGADATVDVRGLRAVGNWSEWITVGADGVAVLPESTTQVQARLVLTGDPGPVVKGVSLTAAAPSQTEGTAALGVPLTYSVYATREGLPGGTTANGHVIAPHDHFVALPSRRALSPNGKSDYSVQVCAANGRCVFAPVWDVGPWNTHDDYWNPATLRERWTDLAQGTPQAQAAYRNDYNDGKDQYNRHVVNPAGIDLGDGVFWDDLGLITNSPVTVTYLWTGAVRLAKVVDTGPVLASPEPDAKVVGVAANDAGVPAECTVGDWLRIGVGQYLATASVPDLADIGKCADTGSDPDDGQ